MKLRFWKNGSEVYIISMAGLISDELDQAGFDMMHFPRGMNKKYEIYKSVYLKYLESMNEVARDTITEVIDINKILERNDRFFFTDSMHINKQGAKLYGYYIADKLKGSIGILLDSKNN